MPLHTEVCTNKVLCVIFTYTGCCENVHLGVYLHLPTHMEMIIFSSKTLTTDSIEKHLGLGSDFNNRSFRLCAFWAEVPLDWACFWQMPSDWYLGNLQAAGISQILWCTLEIFQARFLWGSLLACWEGCYCRKVLLSWWECDLSGKGEYQNAGFSVTMS